MCEDTKKAKVSYSDLYAGLFSWNHIFECCFDQVCCRCVSGASGSEASILAMI